MPGLGRRYGDAEERPERWTEPQEGDMNTVALFYKNSMLPFCVESDKPRGFGGWPPIMLSERQAEGKHRSRDNHKTHKESISEAPTDRDPCCNNQSNPQFEL